MTKPAGQIQPQNALPKRMTSAGINSQNPKNSDVIRPPHNR
ncbi:hypothetical protein UNSW2_995 [Campylobacter concisus UNSW2]|uniref:Uncharacterized protein n=1 Tax=Campylobacter concisus UNSW2 TaxID=1242965 RepID=U2GYK4_9BACT|nr:hypothetical protein UNSW2_995 [Campylobacter concisus UNSW2]